MMYKKKFLIFKIFYKVELNLNDLEYTSKLIVFQTFILNYDTICISENKTNENNLKLFIPKFFIK